MLIYKKKDKKTIEKVDYIRKYRLAACDITSNCNLRCKFCFNCFEQKNINMTQEVLMQMLKVLPYVLDTTYENNSGFYFSCLWEPSIHPHFIELLELLPIEGKNKIFFTTNFAKAQDMDFFERLSRCNIHHINVSIETLSKKKYCEITNGTEIFFENLIHNLENLTSCFLEKIEAPKIRYISMALKSNQHELTDIIMTCHRSYHAFLSEVRTPFVGQYLLQLKDELLDKEEIVQLEKELKGLPVNVSCYLEYQDQNTIENHGRVTGDQHTINVAYCPVKEDYYDLRLNSNGLISWNADRTEIPYDEKMDYCHVFEDKLLQLITQETIQNQICQENVLTALQNASGISRNVHVHLDRVKFDGRIWEITGWAGMDCVNVEPLVPLVVISEKTTILAAYVCKRIQRDDVASMFGENYRHCGFSVLIEEKVAHLLSGKKGYIYWYDTTGQGLMYKINRFFRLEDTDDICWQI